MIASGQLKSGDYLPSVRQLAGDLEVNPMTVSKAYGFLESHGKVNRIRGKGMIIAEQKNEQSIAERLEQLSPLTDTLIQQSGQLGLNKDQVIQWLSHKLDKDFK